MQGVADKVLVAGVRQPVKRAIRLMAETVAIEKQGFVRMGSRELWVIETDEDWLVNGIKA